jgi:hypothetical protein
VTDARVRLVGAEPSGLAELIAGLIEQHLVREPSRANHLRRSVVVLSVPDAGVEITVRLQPGRVEVRDGGAPDAHLRVSAPSARLLALAAAPLRAGLPDPLDPEGRAVLRDVVTGRVRVRGMLTHPVRLARFASLLSVHEGSGSAA